MDYNIYFIIGSWAFMIFYFFSYMKKKLSTDHLEPREKYGCLDCASQYQPHIKFCYDCKTKLENIRYFKFDEQL